MVKKQTKNKEKVVASRKEAWMRIVVAVVSGITLGAWAYLIVVLFAINFIYGIFTGKRLRELAEMSEIWNTQMYMFNKYMIFLSNVRPFPFTSLSENMSDFE